MITEDVNNVELMREGGWSKVKASVYYGFNKTFIRHRYAILAFFVPAIIFTIALRGVGIYPFGDQSIAISDGYHQFMPFMSELQYKLRHGGSLFYSWNGAGGYNFLAMMAYYGGSPINLLIALFPDDMIQEGTTFILTLKIGLAGSFMFTFLKRAYLLPNAERGYDKLSANLICVAFGSMYAVSSYTMGYYWCFMWFDVLTLMPLCVLGLHRLVNDSKPVLYCLSLALAVISNYYIAYMVCLFIGIYYFVLWFKESGRGGLSEFVSKTLEVGFFSLIGLGISAAVFFPTYMGMRKAYYFHPDMPADWEVSLDPLVIVNQVFPYSHLTHWGGAPNLYCGLLCVVMLLLFFACKTISRREKIANGVLLWVMMASFSLNKLNFIWHGFHFPNTLPYRNSFVACFLLVELAYRTFTQIRHIDSRQVWRAMGLIIAFYFLAYHELPSDIEDHFKYLYRGTLFLAAYVCLLILLKRQTSRQKIISALTLCVVSAELVLAALTLVPLVSTISRDSLNEGRDAIANAEEGIDNKLGRTEGIDISGVINAASNNHYRRITWFSSTLDADATLFLRRIGLAGEPGANNLRYQLSDPITNAIMNIKYLMSYDQNYDDMNLHKIKDYEGGVALYENRYPLSVGYMVPDSIRAWQNDKDNSFDNLTNFVTTATNGKYDSMFEETKAKTYGGNMSLDFYEEGHIVAHRGEEQKGNVTLFYYPDKTTNYYVYLMASQLESAQIELPDIRSVWISNRIGPSVSIGRVEAGQEVRINLTFKDEAEGDIYVMMCRIDEDKWSKVYSSLASNKMEVERWDDTYIRGSIKADNDGVMLTSVLYDEGWRAYVDGQRVYPEEPIGGKLLAIELSRGEHEIELRYIPAGFIIGMLTTILSCILLYLSSDKGKVIVRRVIDGMSDARKRLQKFGGDDAANSVDAADEQNRLNRTSDYGN